MSYPLTPSGGSLREIIFGVVKYIRNKAPRIFCEVCLLEPEYFFEES